MSLSLTPKKAIVALAALAPLIVAGCSSADEETAAKNTSTVTSTSETPSATPTEDPEHKDEHDKKEEDQHPEGQQPKPGNQAAAGGAPAQGGHNGQPVNPFDQQLDQQRLNVAPVEGGQPADEQTIGEIRQLLDGAYQQETLTKFMQYIPNNTCRAALDEIGGANAFNMDELDPATRAQFDRAYELMPNRSYIESVTNVQRNGDRASATVTVNTPQGKDESIQRYQIEDGQWKFCK
ncbi:MULTISPECIES: hypothetical protein [Corynebacterium]|uniref:Secreted protein n=1 Tax=Corynebacterium pseudodiphtheriticum TaxID=37637 RepID=A0AAP4BQ73_9CORY|nr:MULTISPECIES: hypothetical protein [Corynebacterium]MDK4206205.1 hypothetical protein [Corynebacterium pseudodiphtheriticum]MDK4236334.1 hypothetical protein [Corynebacterium pseudodiphtheriticum]MDK4242973.1 hypothetical protein [Corynebacterium pseudodiphtheriticum]MDK4249493.1 hypothetical protein [Corynebacterium pseudodiphtheriticum]MDK4290296.1 hypothetical protein [Corynebacterium pseudodiphtheriticum]